MRLASYAMKGAAEPAAPRSAFVMANDVFVDVGKAYEDWCRVSGAAVDDNTLAVLSNLSELVRHGLGTSIWSTLQQVYGWWRESANVVVSEAVVHSEAAAPCLPFHPRTFRDFYAFEQHVSTCRRNRGLDMVPEWYQFPVFYFSNPFSFRGPEEPVFAPRDCTALDYELEVACVIGKAGRDIPAAQADEYILGYVILNDWSARDIQREEVKVGLGPAKGKDFATSFGPYLVTPDELCDVEISGDRGKRHQLTMQAAVNGRTISRGDLRELYFTFAEMIERASSDVQLMPGDVIGSGTVGTGCIFELGTELQDWLVPGDVVELSVDRMGVLRTPIIDRPETRR